MLSHRQKPFFAQAGVRDGMVVPLHGADGIVGAVVVGERMGEMASFSDSDVRLLEMVAAHLEIALRSADLVERLGELGYRHIGWDVEVYEWDPGRTADEIAGRAVDGVLARGDGAILLLHTWPDPVAPALGEIVERLRAERARFVGLDELGLPDGLTPIGQPQPPLAAPVE